MYLLSLPTIVSVLLAIVIASAVSVALHFVIHPIWAGELSEGTKKTADNVAVRIGVIYAVVIGMMFANVRIEHVQMVEAIESEASALVRLYSSLEREAEAESEEVRKKLVEYIRFIVEEQWPAIRAARAQPGDRYISGGTKLDPIWDYVLRVEQKTANKNLCVLLNEVEHDKLMRLFDTKGNVLPLFWYIALFGYLASLIPLYVYPPSIRRCGVISLYSSLVSVVLLAIFILSHPYSAAAGIEPIAFKTLLDAV